MRKIAIIGASYLQDPLIRKAKSMGLETHVFAWRADDVGERTADCFYPISIREKDLILEECERIGIDGICSIASDLAVITVNHVANRMGFVCNSDECTRVSTNKYAMRKRFEEHGIPSPRSILVRSVGDVCGMDLTYPAIVKPTDRSGSRGVTLVEGPGGLADAINRSLEVSFEKSAVIEEYAEGREYSAECISWNGEHRVLAFFRKYSTGEPHFILTGHMYPSGLDADAQEKITEIVFRTLDCLGIMYGASCVEFNIDADGDCRIIEVGGRMCGELIGSTLVEESTGVDFVRAVIDMSLGNEPEIYVTKNRASAVRYVLSQKDLDALDELKKGSPGLLLEDLTCEITDREVTDASTRFGCWTMASDDVEDLIPYMPTE